MLASHLMNVWVEGLLRLLNSQIFLTRRVCKVLFYLILLLLPAIVWDLDLFFLFRGPEVLFSPHLAFVIEGIEVRVKLNTVCVLS